MTDEQLNTVAPDREIMPTGDVLEIIEPVDPDNLVHVGGGVYEARWLDAAEGAEEIAGLKNQRGRVRIISEEPFAPEALPKGIAIQFAVAPLPFQHSAEVN